MMLALGFVLALVGLVVGLLGIGALHLPPAPTTFWDRWAGPIVGGSILTAGLGMMVGAFVA